MRSVVLAALSLAAFSNLSCKVNDYCLECLHGDGGPHDSGPGGDGDDGGGGMDGSGSGSGCQPTQGGVEICDGIDNDCNGLIDDGTLPGVGSACDNVVGECAGGTKVCVTKFHCSVSTTTTCFSTTDTANCPAGENCVAADVTTDHLGCTKNPTFEICDGKDNNCNGATDEGDPGGGTKCGTDVGECVAGTNHCIGGAIQCQGAIGGTMPPYGSPEVCDGKDNNCNGLFDEGLTNMGTCGQSGMAPCMLGTLSCIGGAPQCTGEVDPTFEICDGIDNDCNGIVDDGYDKQHDPNNCGASCQQCTVPGTFNANPVCTNGTCGFSCKTGYKDLDGDPTNGCEFGPCFPTGAEVCDGLDNNCNGQIDEGVTIANFCQNKGECAGTTPTCTGAGGWVCNYPSTVETSGGTVVAQETRCDNKDNDCDGRTDEGTPNLGDACHDNGVGVCQTSGHLVCDMSNITGPAVCDNSSPGQTASAEACDNKDNDCDGNVDEDMNVANTPGIEWINIGGGHQMAKYEMSKPDASTTDPGSVTAHACSRGSVEPWVNVTYPQALAACQSIGATLCGETEWHRACSVIDANTYPLGVATTGTRIEAEDYSGIASATDAEPETACSGNTDDDGDGFINDGCPQSGAAPESGANCLNATDDDGDGKVNDGCPAKGSTRAWVEDSTPGFSGIGDIAAIVNAGVNVPIANAIAESPRVDYQINFPATGNWHIWVKMFSATTNDNTLYMSLSTGAPITPNITMTVATNGAWTWVDSGNVNIPATGNRTLSIWMGKDGVRIDQIYLVQGTGAAPTTLTSKGGTWSYATNPTTYVGTTCNGQDFNYAVALTSETRASNVVTVTTSSPHVFAVGETVTISGVADATFNGTFTIATVPSATTFTYAQTAANASSTGGTATDPGDRTMPTGSLTSCYANDTLLAGGTANDHGFDMSGNVKEWVLAEQPGHNPIRGGSSNNTGPGISCALNFTLADNTFFFTNVGFRCCK